MPYVCTCRSERQPLYSIQYYPTCFQGSSIILHKRKAFCLLHRTYKLLLKVRPYMTWWLQLRLTTVAKEVLYFKAGIQTQSQPCNQFRYLQSMLSCESCMVLMNDLQGQNLLNNSNPVPYRPLGGPHWYLCRHSDFN